MGDESFFDLLGAARLPTVLAVQARQVDDALDPYTKLNALYHLFENLLRLTTGPSVITQNRPLMIV